jgi:uncharacterized protein (UPF0264 family)
MNYQTRGCRGPALLVSVRNADEALQALAGGADVIDVKEPLRGPLGAADALTIDSIVRAVSGRAPVTAAMGELTEWIDIRREPLPAGVSMLKIGLSACRSRADWRAHWRNAVAQLGAGHAAAAAVAYADWRSAGAPHPADVVRTAIEDHCPALLIDTWNKSGGTLFDYWPPHELGPFVESARKAGLIVVLAGSLAGQSIATAARLGPDLVGVRAAACDGGRRGAISAARVCALRTAIAAGANGAPAESRRAAGSLAQKIS